MRIKPCLGARSIPNLSPKCQLIVEGLTNLKAITQEQVFFAALPLKPLGGDGSPVRAFAMEYGTGRISAARGHDVDTIKGGRVAAPPEP